MKNKIIKASQLLLPIILGGIVGFLISNNINYSELVKPPLAPPKIFFPIAWTIIYILMGISYNMYRNDNNDSRIKFIYYLQLFVNLLWSVIFFIWKARLLAVLWIVLLDILVIILIKRFFYEKPISAKLNIPYLIWILFATYLTIGIFILN